MALRTPSSSNIRDPFELERLAAELDERELRSPNTKTSFDSSHDLPIYAPLSHSNTFFLAETFNVEEFLLSRSHTSLQDLRSELRDYLAVLKEELVQLINDDYEAFISLSTDLKGEGARLERLQYPLGDLKSQILKSRRGLQLVQEGIQTKLKARSALRDEKAYLHLLLKISESVTRLESLLLIASPDGSSSPESKPMQLSRSHSAGDDDGADERTRGNRAKHLSRVATEYTQLLYHVAKAQAESRSAFVDDIQWRIDRVQSTLSSDLDHLFSTTLLSVADLANKVSDADRTKKMTDLAECLRTYDIMGLWRDAEDVLRREVVREFVKKTVFPGALTAPHSPLLPVTPFPVRERPVPTTAGLPPRTPYTPFTAFATKESPFGSPNSSVHLLDDYGNPLAALYNNILKFVERDLKKLMDVAEKISVKSNTKPPVNGLLNTASNKADVFDIMANVVWAEVGRAIMDELGSVVFAAGKPNEFRKNHETTHAFIRSLQFLAPSSRAAEVMVAHPVYLAFERRWQLPVYFQLRWKEIIPRLEESLSTTKIEPSSNKECRPFITQQVSSVWSAINTCWSGDVFMPQLAHRFWKLTLQILSRYKTWIENSQPKLDGVGKLTASERVSSPGGTPNLTRASTPTPPVEGTSAENAAADDAILRQLAAAIADIKIMESQMWQFWQEALSMMLPELPEDDEDEVRPEGMSATLLISSFIKTCCSDALRKTLDSLVFMVGPMSAQVVSILSKRACDALLPVRSIPSQFRAMSNKRMPTEPSYFVASILRPLKIFFSVGTSEGPGSSLKGDFLRVYSEEVFETVVQRFISYLGALKKTEESLRRLKKGKKSTFSLFGGGSAKEDDSRDEERIRTQMILDVEAFGKDAESLGVDVGGSSSFKVLDEMVHASFTDGTYHATLSLSLQSETQICPFRGVNTNAVLMLLPLCFREGA
ncbi:COG complex component [Amylostereum chailletii]|nr:COG complex component [Amylostereum chailletii]